MVTKKSLNHLKKVLGLTGAMMVASAIAPNTANAQTKVVDNKNDTEVTVTPNNYIVVDTATVEGVLTAQNEKEAQKLLASYSKQYGIDKDNLPQYFEHILANYAGQEYLYFETIKNDMKPHKHTINLLGEKDTFKYKSPGPKKGRFDCLYYVAGDKKIDVDYTHILVNAKDVFEKSGLDMLNPLANKKFSLDGLTDMMNGEIDGEQKTIIGDKSGIVMNVNKDGRLDGVSTILQFKDGKSEEIAHLTYDNGKFIGGDVNGQPIQKVNSSKQMAMQKALDDLRQNI